MKKAFKNNLELASMAAAVETTFSTKLRQLRGEKGLSQQAVANAIGVHKNSYQQYEYGGKFPAFATLALLADFLDVSIDYLAGRTDVPQVVRSAQWQANQEL